jgi:hypothetical protein
MGEWMKYFGVAPEDDEEERTPPRAKTRAKRGGKKR